MIGKQISVLFLPACLLLLNACSTSQSVSDRSGSDPQRKPAQAANFESTYECAVNVVGAPTVSDRLFLKLLWIPPFPGHPGHASPSRKSIWMGTQEVNDSGREPANRPNSPLENFVANKQNPLNEEPWASSFPEFGYLITASNFDPPKPPGPYTLADFAKFSDDTVDGNGGHAGVSFTFSAPNPAGVSMMKFTQFKGPVAGGQVDYQITGSCKVTN